MNQWRQCEKHALSTCKNCMYCFFRNTFRRRSTRSSVPLKWKNFENRNSCHQFPICRHHCESGSTILSLSHLASDLILFPHLVLDHWSIRDVEFCTRFAAIHFTLECASSAQFHRSHGGALKVCCFLRENRNQNRSRLLLDSRQCCLKVERKCDGNYCQELTFMRRRLMINNYISLVHCEWHDCELEGRRRGAWEEASFKYPVSLFKTSPLSTCNSAHVLLFTLKTHVLIILKKKLKGSSVNFKIQ